MMADRADEIHDKTSVAAGDAAVRISVVMDEATSSSGRPAMADKRLRINVFMVGSSNE